MMILIVFSGQYREKEGSVYGGSAWCIGSTTEHQDLAVALLKEMVSDETLTAVAAGGSRCHQQKPWQHLQILWENVLIILWEFGKQLQLQIQLQHQATLEISSRLFT